MRSDILKQTEIFIFLALVFSVFVAMLSLANNKLNSNLQNLELDNIKSKAIDSLVFVTQDSLIDILKSKLDSANQEIERYKSNDLLLRITDANDIHFFESGSAKATRNLSAHINTTVIPIIESRLMEFPQNNCITVIGHTDHVPISGENKTFDKEVITSSTRQSDIGNIECNSNAELGLLRAYVICQILKENELIKKSIKYWQPLSGGPFIDEKEFTIVRKIEEKDIQEKRRIEIKISKLEIE